MKSKLLLSITLFFSVTLSLSAQDHSGKLLYLYGNSARALGRAGTGVASDGTDLFYINPAAIANAERLGISINYGSLALDYHNPDITLAAPSSYGVFGASVRTFFLSDSDDFERGYALSLGFAKDLSQKILFGLSGTLFYGSADNSVIYAGGSLGTIYKLDGSRKKYGFGLFDPKIGLALNLGIPIGDNSSDAQFNSLTLGYNFNFYNHKNFTLGFYNEVSMIDFYSDFPVKAGLESVINDKYIVRAGTHYPQAYEYGTVSAGVGYKFSGTNFEGSVNYAFNYSKEYNTTHYIGTDIEYGTLDRTPPETKITSDKMYVSPNHDGIQDYVTFETDVNDASRIKGWKMQIIAPDNRVIKEFKASNRDIIQSLTPKEFFKRLFSKKESQVVPGSILWDGTDSKGKIVPDDKYTYAFNAWDERGNIAALKKGTIIIDRTPPVVYASTKETLFSPNGDNQKDLLIIKHKVTTASQDTWEAHFEDTKGNIVKKYSWSGSNVPHTLSWDGKDDKGKDVPEGLYYYSIKSNDKAGNKTSDVITEITLTRKYETADVQISQEIFSFKKDKNISIFPKLSNTKNLTGWKIIIKDSGDDIVKEYKGNTTLPNVITYNCTDNNNKKLNDGTYYITFSTLFDSGNTPASYPKKLIIDSTPPEVDISHSPDLFSPDNDGENDVLSINSESSDQNGISTWTINIFAPNGTVFKSFTGTGNPPKEIKWDGLGTTKDIVESAADYAIQLQTIDNAGNVAKTDREKLQVDILVVVTERGLKMRISNIEFAFNSAKLKKKGKRILDRVHEILQKYERYDVLVEGHTDDVGEEDYNLKLSEKRAESVLKYLIDQGTDKERLTFIGMGETVPLYPNTNEENKRRNRRVEFLLIKEKNTK